MPSKQDLGSYKGFFPKFLTSTVVLLIWKSPPRGGKPSGSMVLSDPKVKSLNIVRVLVTLLIQFGKVPLFAQVWTKMLADSLNLRCLLELHTLSFQEFVTQVDR